MRQGGNLLDNSMSYSRGINGRRSAQLGGGRGTLAMLLQKREGNGAHADEGKRPASEIVGLNLGKVREGKGGGD